MASTSNGEIPLEWSERLAGNAEGKRMMDTVNEEARDLDKQEVIALAMRHAREHVAPKLVGRFKAAARHWFVYRVVDDDGRAGTFAARFEGGALIIGATGGGSWDVPKMQEVIELSSTLQQLLDQRKGS